MLALSDWSALLEKEYLAAFVPAGGAAVKIALAPPERAAPVLETLESAARRQNLAVARVSAAQTRVQFIEQIFFAVSSQTDWEALCRQWLRARFAENGYDLAPDQNLSDLETIGAAREQTARDVIAEVRRWIVNGVLKNYRLDKDFRTAMAMLCQAAVNPGNVSPSDAEVLVQWLRGEKTSLSALKKLQIFSKIGRHNARSMLTSLALWHRENGQNGLFVALDACQIWNAAPVDPSQPMPRYTRNATLDFYEILRQFIDETDELAHFFLLVCASPDGWSDPKKGVDQYTALKMRVADEVRDRDRANPLGAAVKIEVFA